MFQILNLSKRVDATETGISKLASMLEDLAREQPLLANPLIQQKASDLQVEMRATSKTSISTSATKLAEELKDKISKLEKRVQKVEENVGKVTAAATSAVGFAAESAAGSVSGSAATMTSQVSEKVRGAAEASEDSAALVRLTDLEKKFTEYTDHLSTMNTVFNNQITTLQSHLTDLEKEIGEIVERINAGFPAGDSNASEQGVHELYNKIMAMQEEMEKMTTTATKLLEDKEERQVHMDALLEQIELLKTIKANREDLQDALADKADTCTVNKKVSHDQFDAACDGLTRSIEDALNKLMHQEQLWQQALTDIQNEIGNKLDKMELTPLRDFVHNKLKMLQDRLKALTALKKETEAAGTKSKFLRNVNCISCDKDVVMRKQMDPTLMPAPPALPPTKSMGPYLAYELDNLRKQQKCMPHSRNLNHFENAISGVKTGQDEDHICNRYCGGSHTLTTPQQRVARLGHFLQQWGPESQAINEGEIRGTDGQMYKSRDIGYISQRNPPSVDENYTLNMKSRPSMVVHGDILSARGGLRSVNPKEDEKSAVFVILVGGRPVASVFLLLDLSKTHAL